MSETLCNWIAAQAPGLREFAQALFERVISLIAQDQSWTLVELEKYTQRIETLEQRIDALESADRMQVADR